MKYSIGSHPHVQVSLDQLHGIVWFVAFKAKLDSLQQEEWSAEQFPKKEGTPYSSVLFEGNAS